jgi:parallel beta-helix repeat protein
MTLTDALKILGLEPDEDPSPHLAEFKNAREHIAGMVRTAPNTTLADRYQKGLMEFDQALAALQEHLGNVDIATPPLPSRVSSPSLPIPAPPKTVVLGVAPTAPKVAVAEVAVEEMETAGTSPGRGLSYFAWFLVFLIGASGGGWLYMKREQTKEEQRLLRITFLERQGSIMIENRRWQDAANAFREIEKLSPGSQIVLRGRRSIEAGMGEEQTQFIGYWTGQATAELEAGRLDEASAAARQVLDKYPAEKDAAAILAQVSIARVGQAAATTLASAREAMDQRKWSAAITLARQVLKTTPDDPAAKSILTDATTALAKAAADTAKAAELLKMAIVRDNGQFDQQALDWLREASSLDPGNKEIAARLEKLSAYTRTLRVPEDFATLQQALSNAHDRDRIVLGAATWKGPLVINVDVEIQGAGFATTKIECAADAGSALTIGPGAKGVRISGITFRHESFVTGSERFSTVLVRSGSVAFVDCRFTEASGHGLAVIEGGQATVTRSRFADNGWNGAAAMGSGSQLEIRDSEALNNFEHGIESWDGATVTLINNRCEGNSRNGIHTDNGTAPATIEGNQLISNREFGLVLDSAGSGKITGNTARANLLGGLVIRTAAAKLAVTTNQATLNQGPGLILEKGLKPDDYTNNSVAQNTGQQILSDTILSPAETKTTAPEEITQPAPIVKPPPVKKRKG